ncbi:response regulator transcription factor [Neobacillus sp. LXY-1]|uniref:response regulator transcription factor n=1 Tax=Neobacillus sp. LXY-1 TaxID=3379133 RepID=UPI003EDE7E36
MRNKILVVDDERSIVTLLEYNLVQAGFEVATAFDGNEGRKLAVSESPDLIILDWMLPELDGLEVCKQLRQEKIMTPIIMLTARDHELDKVLGLELGADDYMVKPFSPREVIARVKAILRRSLERNDQQSDDESKINISNLIIYPKKYEAYYQGKRLDLTLKEFELLVFMAQNKGNVLTRDQLLNAVWNDDFSCGTRIVDVHISHLRNKIEGEIGNPVYIKTIRGIGYKLDD